MTVPKTKVKKRVAARAKPKMRPSREKIMEVGEDLHQQLDIAMKVHESVMVDEAFPGAVFDALAVSVAPLLKNGTQVQLTVRRSPQNEVALGTCSKRHVHVIMAPSSMLCDINLALVFAWALALYCDRTGNWEEPPQRWRTSRIR